MRKKSSLPLPKPYEEYLRWYDMRLGPCDKQVKMIRSVLARFNHYLSDRKIRLRSLRIEQIDAFFGHHYISLARSTRRLYRTFIRGFLSYLHHERGILKKDLAQLVVGAPNFARSKPPRFLRRQDIQALFTDLSVATPSELMNSALLCLAYTLGLRPREIRHITLDDISLTKAELTIRERKGDNPLKLPLPEIVVKMIAAYLIGARPKSEHRILFLSLRSPHRPLSSSMHHRRIKKHMRRSNISAVPYALRHTYAQNLLEAGVSIYEIKEMMGHDTIESTRKYLHVHIKLMREVLFDDAI